MTEKGELTGKAVEFAICRELGLTYYDGWGRLSKRERTEWIAFMQKDIQDKLNGTDDA